MMRHGARRPSVSTSGTSITRTLWSAVPRAMGSSVPFGVSTPSSRASPQISDCGVRPSPLTMTYSLPYATSATSPSTCAPPNICPTTLPT